jgi:DNA-binding CsgD family transcriptional regulator
MSVALDATPSSLGPVAPVTMLIRSLRGLTDRTELFEAASGMVARLGFDRVIVSQVVDQVWTPAALYIANDPKWASDILAAGRGAPQRLGQGLVEDQMMRTKNPIVVRDVQESPVVNRVIAAASRSAEYLAAPIAVGDEIGGFIHVDRYWSRRVFGPSDAAALLAVADAVGLAVECQLLRECLRTLAPSAPGGGARLAGPATTPRELKAAPVLRGHTPASVLTPREAEVASMIADGLTNSQIAARLFVAEATVKSHIKHILRKLGARHRAEIVSMLLRPAA